MYWCQGKGPYVLSGKNSFMNVLLIGQVKMVLSLIQRKGRCVLLEENTDKDL